MSESIEVLKKATMSFVAEYNNEVIRLKQELQKERKKSRDLEERLERSEGNKRRKEDDQL